MTVEHPRRAGSTLGGVREDAVQTAALRAGRSRKKRRPHTDVQSSSAACPVFTTLLITPPRALTG